MLEPEAQTRCVGASAEDCDGAKQSDGSRRLFRRGRSRVPSAPRRSKKLKRPLFNWDINASVVNVCRFLPEHNRQEQSAQVYMRTGDADAGSIGWFRSSQVNH